MCQGTILHFFPLIGFGFGSSFALMMQTGAFLQFILVLTAIASRLNALLTEVRDALELTRTASCSALQALFVSSR